MVLEEGKKEGIEENSTGNEERVEERKVRKEGEGGRRGRRVK